MPACEIGIPRRHWRWWDAFLVRADPEAWCSKPASVLVGRVRSNALQARSRDAPSLARVEGFATCLDPQDGVTVRGKRCGAPGAALDDPAVCGASSPRAEALGIAYSRSCWARPTGRPVTAKGVDQVDSRAQPMRAPIPVTASSDAAPGPTTCRAPSQSPE